MSSKRRKVTKTEPPRTKRNNSIYCITCQGIIKARLTNGKEIYPYRQDLYKLPFWICDQCHNFVGCHHRTRQRTRPLGCIPDKKMREARGYIHKLMDKILQTKKIKRRDMYARLSQYKGSEYHTAEIRSIEEARDVYRFLLKLERRLN